MYASVLLLWSFVFWAGWQFIGLNSDGSSFLAQLVSSGRFTTYGDFARLYAIALIQGPTVVAIELGMTDLKWIARIYSWTTLGVPALLYSLAIVRARHDADLLGLVLGTVAVIFLPSCLFSIGEYNIAYASVVVAATWLATVRGPSLRDAIVLLLLGLVCLRAYEALLYLGPLVAALAIRTAPPPTLPANPPCQIPVAAIAMALPAAIVTCAWHAKYLTPPLGVLLIAGFVGWTWRFPPALSTNARAVSFVVAALFLSDGVLAALSPRLAPPGIGTYVFSRSIADNVALINPSFLLALAITATAGTAVVRRSRLLLGTSLALLFLLLSASAWQSLLLPETPQAYMAAQTRQICGLLTAAFVLVVLVRRADRSPTGWALPLGFAALVPMAPTSFQAATEWGHAVATLQKELRAKPGIVAFGDLPQEVRRWFRDPVEVEVLADLGRLVSMSDSDGRPMDFRPMKPIIMTEDRAPYLFAIDTRYRWRD